MTDDEIIAVLKRGPQSNRELRVSFGLDHVAYDKQLDQALQRLRRQKTISFNSKSGFGWSLTDTKACPQCRGTGKVPA